VEVPLCWGGGARACPPPPTCGSGTSAVVTLPKGADGGEPCCTQYACLAAERTVRGRPPWRWPLCPSKTACPAPPAKCPSGSSLGVPRDAKIGGGGSGGGAGCPGCETCIDEAGTGRAVALPPCAAAAANAGACPAPPACGTDMTMVIKTPAGANGALPCCPDYACLAPRPSASEAAQGNRQACPARTCVSEPARCSPGARLEQAPRDDAGCPGCPACLGSEGEVVPVPACWARPFSCPPLPVCEPGYAAVLAVLRGSAGTAPCCDTYECRPGTDAEEARNQPGGRRGCAALSCSTMPTRCPANATRRSEKDYMGCPSCPTCLDDKTSERVSVPACYTAPVICPPGACEPGQRSVLKVPRGIDGRQPCCDQYKCVADKIRSAAYEAYSRANAASVSNAAGVAGAAIGEFGAASEAAGNSTRPLPRSSPAAVDQQETQRTIDGMKRCGSLACSSAPHACPAGSSLAAPRDDYGCAKCPQCLDAVTGVSVPVPVCFRENFACPVPACPEGQQPKLAVPRGKNGAVPCCSQFTCHRSPPGTSRPVCTAKTCTASPRRCPLGSRLGVPVDALGCRDCVTCIDRDGVPVPVPFCWSHPTTCAPPPVCGRGELRIKMPMGLGGARPCCDTYVCQGGDDNRGCPKMEYGVNCPLLPTQCPARSKLKAPKNANTGCDGCKTCSDVNTGAPVRIPPCWDGTFVPTGNSSTDGGAGQCPAGQERGRTINKGVEGELPCEAVRGCVCSGFDPEKECKETPYRCPRGSALESRPDASGCPTCPACIDASTLEPISFRDVPTCFQVKPDPPFIPVCPGGESHFILRLRGDNGAAPCFDETECRPCNANCRKTRREIATVMSARAEKARLNLAGAADRLKKVEQTINSIGADVFKGQGEKKKMPVRGPRNMRKDVVASMVVGGALAAGSAPADFPFKKFEAAVAALVNISDIMAHAVAARSPNSSSSSSSIDMGPNVTSEVVPNKRLAGGKTLVAFTIANLDRKETETAIAAVTALAENPEPMVEELRRQNVTTASDVQLMKRPKAQPAGTDGSISADIDNPEIESLLSAFGVMADSVQVEMNKTQAIFAKREKDVAKSNKNWKQQLADDAKAAGKQVGEVQDEIKAKAKEVAQNRANLKKAEEELEKSMKTMEQAGKQLDAMKSDAPVAPAEDGKKANAKAKEKIMKILNDKLEQLKKSEKATVAINNINNTAADAGGVAKPEG